MGVRSSDIMAFTAILAGAGAGYGLTNLYAHSQQEEAPAVAELTNVVETAVPRVDAEVEPVRVDVEPFRVRVGHGPTVIVTTTPHVITMMHMRPHVVVETAPHIVTRMRMRRPDQAKIEELRREARHRAQEARARAREVRDNIRFGEDFAFQEALSSFESLKALKTLESLDALESLDNLENVVNLEALEQALEELERELDGVLTIDVDELHDVDDQHKRKKRKKRRIIVKWPGNDGSGG